MSVFWIFILNKYISNVIVAFESSRPQFYEKYLETQLKWNLLRTPPYDSQSADFVCRIFPSGFPTPLLNFQGGFNGRMKEDNTVYAF